MNRGVLTWEVATRYVSGQGGLPFGAILERGTQNLPVANGRGTGLLDGSTVGNVANLEVVGTLGSQWSSNSRKTVFLNNFFIEIIQC